MTERSGRERWAEIARWTLVVLYPIGIALLGWLEITQRTISQRLNLPPWMIWGGSAVQVLCVVGLAYRRSASWAALGLTATTLGAAGAHLRVGAPLHAIPALAFTALQLWIARVFWPERWRPV
jgi:FtsH-binding integral membrane protein